MKILRTWMLVASLLVLGSLFAQRCLAQPEKAVKVTFSAPVEVPGAALPPGAYLFQVMPNTNGNLVQIWNEDHTKFYTIALTIPDSSPRQPTDKPVIMFAKNEPDAPPAVQEFYTPGEDYARKFVYPKSQAMRLAKANQQSVPDMPDNKAANMNQPANSAQDAPAVALLAITIKAIDPSGQEVAQDQNMPQQQGQQQGQTSQDTNGGQHMSGTVSADGKTFTNASDNKTYTVNNPDAVTAFDGQPAGVIVQLDPDDNVIHVIHIEAPQQ
jgi:hypothetical protein